MAVEHVPPAEAGGHATSTGLDNVKIAMWAFLGSEFLLFGALISTYLLYRNRAVTGPKPARRLRHPLHLGLALSCS